MLLVINEVDHHLDPAPRGNWEVKWDDGSGETGVVVLLGWDGEMVLTITQMGMQCGVREYVVVQQHVDNPIYVHRVAAAGFGMDAEVELRDKLIALLNELMDDGIEPRFPVSDAVKAETAAGIGRMRKTLGR